MNWKKKYYLDIGIAILIAVLPFCMYAYLLIDKTITEFTFLGKVYEPQEGTVQLGVYFVTARLIPFLLFSIWFVCSKERFSWFLLVPIYYNFHKAVLYISLLFRRYPEHENYLGSLMLLLLLLYLFYLLKRYRGQDVRSFSLFKNNIFALLLNKKRKYKIHQKTLDSVSLFRSRDKKYLQNLFYSKEILGENKELSFKKNISRWWIKRIAILFFLSTPLFYNLFRYVPEDYVFYFYPMSEPNGRCISFSAFVYFMVMKLVPIISLILWFITSNNWFRTVILIPLIVYTYQVHEILFGNSGRIDEVEYLQSLPLVLIVLLLTYIVSVIYKYDLKSYSIRKQLDQEIDRLINKFAKRNSEL